MREHRLASAQHPGVCSDFARVLVDVDRRKEYPGARRCGSGDKIARRALFDDQDHVGLGNLAEAVEHDHLEIAAKLACHALAHPLPGCSASARAYGERRHPPVRSVSSFDLSRRKNSARERSPYLSERLSSWSR